MEEISTRCKFQPIGIERGIEERIKSSGYERQLIIYSWLW